MPAPLALLLGLTAGASFAWLAPPTERGEAPSRRAAWAFGALVLGPAAGYLELAANAWANLYLFELPSAVDLALVAAVAASPSVGEAALRRSLARGDPRLPVVLLGALATSLVAGAAAARDRLAVVTSHAAFHRGLGGEGLFEHRAGAALAGALVAIAIGVALGVRDVLGRRSH